MAALAGGAGHVTSVDSSGPALEQAGATAILICANSMHKVYDRVQASVSVPIIHIADCVGEKMQADGIKRHPLPLQLIHQRQQGLPLARGVSLLPRINVELSAVLLDPVIYEEAEPLVRQFPHQAANALPISKVSGYSQMQDAVTLAARELRHTERLATVVLITDGLETCKADPCAVGKALEESGVDFTAHVVGFGLSAEDGAGSVAPASISRKPSIPSSRATGRTNSGQVRLVTRGS